MPGYERKSLERWVTAYLLCLANGCDLNELAPADHCVPSCALPGNAANWALVDGPFGKHYACPDCGRFIGYPAK